MTLSRFSIGVVLFVSCFLFREQLVGDPVMHVLVQLPALALVGAMCVSNRTTAFFDGSWNEGGFTTLFIALTGIAFWMLPRSIDAALTSPYMEIAKFLSIPLVVGVPLKITWDRAHPLLRGFLKAEAISMLTVMAFLYTHAPVRICNAYLVRDQERLGYGFLFAAIALSVLWTAPLFKQKSSGQRTRIVAGAAS